VDVDSAAVVVELAGAVVDVDSAGLDSADVVVVGSPAVLSEPESPSTTEVVGSVANWPVLLPQAAATNVNRTNTPSPRKTVIERYTFFVVCGVLLSDVLVVSAPNVVLLEQPSSGLYFSSSDAIMACISA